VSSVIAGATTPAQVFANAAAGNWTPTPNERLEINEVSGPRSRDEAPIRFLMATPTT